MNSQQHAYILEPYYYLSVYNVQLRLTLSAEYKNSFLTDPILSLYTTI